MRVPAVERSVRVLRAIAEAGRPVSLAELAAQTGLPRSSLHDLLDSLRITGLVDRDRNQEHTLGLLLVELAGSRLANNDLVAEFVHACDRDVALAGRTLVLGILDDDDVMYVATRAGDATLAVNYHIGKRLPAHCTATGKAILGTLLKEQQLDLFAGDRPLRALTPSSITAPEQLVDDLRAGGDRGYAVDDEETAVGMLCVGAPVFPRSGRSAVAAVATSMVKAGLDDDALDRLAEGIVALAHDISAHLGARPRSPAESAPPGSATRGRT